jgi:hypothetical protein
MSVLGHPGRASAQPSSSYDAQSAGTAFPLRFRWLVRPRRVLLLLAAIWDLNIFDLCYTLGESGQRAFVEMNPIAARLANEPGDDLVAYKLGLLTVGSVILLLLSRERIAELTCWMLLAASMYVAVRWFFYYVHAMDTINDPATNVTIARLPWP